MITYQNNKFWQRPWFLAAAGMTVIAGVAWWWTSSHQDASGNIPSATNGSNNGWFSSGSTANNTPSGSTPALLAEGRPADLPESDWNALKSVLSKTMPNAEAEAARVVDYLKYQKRFEYWQTTEGNKSPKERAGLAEALLQEIPARMAKGEFTTAEGVLMTTVLISEIETDDAKRQQRIVAAQEQLLKSAPPQDNEKLVRDAERATEQKRLIATTFAEWQSKPEASRTPAALETALLDAQRTFNAGTSN